VRHSVRKDGGLALADEPEGCRPVMKQPAAKQEPGL